MILDNFCSICLQYYFIEKNNVAKFYKISILNFFALASSNALCRWQIKRNLVNFNLSSFNPYIFTLIIRNSLHKKGPKI